MTYRTWEDNARIVEETFGGEVDWEERFYICPWCGDLVYECDWTLLEFDMWICPICEDDDWHDEDDPEPADLECGFDPYEGGYTYDC